MLTKTFDFTKVMCVQYWPASKDKDEIYGDVYVGVCKEEQLANFHIRTFRMYRKDGEVSFTCSFFDLIKNLKLNSIKNSFSLIETH